MLRLAAGRRFYILRLVMGTGTNYSGLEITRGRTKPKTLWFHIRDEAIIPRKAAHLLRQQLDRGLEESEAEMDATLLELPIEPKEQLLIDALDKAKAMPPHIKYRTCKIAQPSVCSICNGALQPYEEAVSWFEIDTLNLACPDCTTDQEAA